MTAAIAVVGDLNLANPTHAGTNSALEHAGASYEWVPTEQCARRADERLDGYRALWIAPASPYRSMDGALHAIRHARERGVPLVGT